MRAFLYFDLLPEILVELDGLTSFLALVRPMLHSEVNEHYYLIFFIL